MKKIISITIFVFCITIGFGQIKTSTSVLSPKAPAKLYTINNIQAQNTDSLELKNLYENYKALDKATNDALEKIITKMKSINDKKPTGAGRELNMVTLQSLVSQRGTMLQMITTMMQKMNESTASIINNLK